MLVLSRKLNQAIMVGDNVRIVVVGVDRDQVKLGIDAPRDIPVHRFEVYEDIQRSNEAATRGESPPERSAKGNAPAAAAGPLTGSVRPANLAAQARPPRKSPR